MGYGRLGPLRLGGVPVVDVGENLVGVLDGLGWRCELLVGLALDWTARGQHVAVVLRRRESVSSALVLST